MAADAPVTFKVAGVGLLCACVAPFFVAVLLRHDVPHEVLLAVAPFAATPVALAFLCTGFAIDRMRNPRLHWRDLDFRLHHALYGQAIVIFFAVAFMARASNDGPAPLQPDTAGIVGALVSMVVVAALGSAAQRRAANADAMSALAAKDPSAAVRFHYRTDQTTWAEVGPASVLGYQRWFETAIDRLGALPPDWEGLSVQQQALLVHAAEEAHSSGVPWPATLVSLVLYYIIWDGEERQAERRSWAAFVTTRQGDQHLRDAAEHYARVLIRRHSRTFK